MTISVKTVGATDLRLASAIVKPNYSLGRTIGGQTGQIMGHWRAIFIRIPAAGFTLNGSYVMFGAEAGVNGTFTSGDDSALRIYGSGAASALKPWARYRGGSAEAYAGTNGAEGQFTALAAMTASPAAFLLIEGVTNTGTAGSPVWRGWAAICQVGSGTPSSQVAATAIAAGWINATTGALMRQIFAAAGTGSARTPVGVAIEHAALVAGDFPWDTVNNRPHHDAIAALAGVGSNPFLTYASLVAAQNAGSLPYANCDQGLGNLDYYWPLTDFAAGLANLGAAGTAPLIQTDWNSLTGGLSDTDVATIAPAHWTPASLSALALDSNSLIQNGNTSIAISGASSGSTISLLSGSLPAGMVLNGGARTISGVPTAVGTSNFTLRETLAGATNTPRDTALSITVAAAPALAALKLSTNSAAQGASSSINIIGATSGSAISLLSGSLPAGMALNGAARTISGTPTASGTATFTLRETLAGASNTPRDTELNIAVSAAVAAPTIFDPILKFAGGRGARQMLVIGTRDANQVVERRWERMDTSAALAGLDWAVAPIQSGTAWSISDALPVGGPYRLRIRYVALPGQTASSDDWLSGTVAIMHGQSGVERVFQQGTTPINYLAISVAAGAQGIYVKLANQTAGSAAAYVQPAVSGVRLRSGETTVLGHGGILCLNEWNASNPGHPLLMVNMAINGTVMAEWANNDQVSSGGTLGHASFRYLGTIGAAPDAISGNNSGVVEMYAAALGRHCDLHLMMWTPNMSGDSTVRANYVAAIDARFSNAASAPFVVLPPWRGHRQPGDSSSLVSKRQEHLDFVTQLGTRGVLGPYWADVVNDGNPNPATAGGTSGSLHCAFHSNATVGGAGSPVSDQNQVGMARLGRGIGRVLAWHFDRSIKAHGPRILAAWSNNNRASVQIELGRAVRTLNGAAISANQFWVSLNNGVAWGRADGQSETLTATGNPAFTVALSADGTRAVLTPADGGTAWAAAGANLRVDYSRRWPFGPSDLADETTAERALDGILYDDQTHRGGVNFAANARPGNPLQGSNRNGAGVAGVAVTARGAAKLVATERWSGQRPVRIRMMAADGVTVLAEKTINVVGQ
jgi:hypothetical protein